MTFENVIDSSMISRFQNYNSNQEITINPHDTYWLRFNIINTDQSDNNWVFDFQNWSYVDFYLSNGHGGFIHKKTGHLIPISERDYAVANKSYILVPLKSNEYRTCYVKLKPIRDMDLFPVDLTFTVSVQRKIEHVNSHFRSIIMMFTGIFLVMFFFNLFVYLSTGEKAYRTYLIILLLGLYMNLIYSGYLFEFLDFTDSIKVLNIFTKINYNLFGIVLLLFLHTFLNIRQRYPLWYKLNLGLIAAMIIADIILFIDYLTGISITGLLNIILIFDVISMTVKSTIDKYPSAKYLLVGYAGFLSVATFQILATLEIIPKTDFTWNYSLTIGQIFEILLFSFALTNKINVLKEDNSRKQAQIMEQLKKNSELQTQVNRELEQKVSDRTIEIMGQKEEIAKQKKYLEIEKERSDRLLLNILPKTIAEELKLNGHATPRYYDQVSILFVDIKGFSRMVDKISPNDLVKDLDYCFTAFDYIVTKNNLEKIKTIGDAYMCVGGLPIENTTHAIDTVAAALEIIDFMKTWEMDQPVLGKNGLVLRLGIHTGPVIAGVVGKKKFQYDIWGDAVNMASRMESNGEPNKLNISESTYHLVKEIYQCNHRGKYNVKNMGEVNMYFVEGKKVTI